MDRPRRQVLGLIGTLGVSALAGCSDSTNSNSDSNDSATSQTGSPTLTLTTTIEPTPTQTTAADSTPTQTTAADSTPTQTTTSTATPTQTATPGPVTGESRAKIAADDGDDRDYFGDSVALSGDGTTALMGANIDEDPNGEEAGSAYVFTSDGGWSQQAKLTADDGDSGDEFGHAVALSEDGTTALIGARYDEDSNGGEAGGAYVFTSDGGWSQQAKLAANDAGDGGSSDHFGESVALSDDGATALVGANVDEDPNGSDAGSAYVFTSDGGWSQQAKLAADDGANFDEFGGSVMLSGDGTTALVGAKYDVVSDNGGAGSAYVFTGDGGWSQQAKLVADDGDSNDHFGDSVALTEDGTTALIGASGDDTANGTGAGSAYVFTSDGGWSRQAKLAVGNEGDRFGDSVALSDDGGTALIGASDDEDPNGGAAGSAYVFTGGDSWSQQAKLAAEDGDGFDRFGGSVALSENGTTALVGASNDEDPNGEFAGSAYVFE